MTLPAIQSESDWISVVQAAQALGVKRRTALRHCEASRYVTRTVQKNGGVQYQISLSSLPPDIQARYWQHHQAANADVTPYNNDTNTLPDAPAGPPQSSGIKTLPVVDPAADNLPRAGSFLSISPDAADPADARVCPSIPSTAKPTAPADVHPVSPELAVWQNDIAGARYDLCVAYMQIMDTARTAKARAKASHDAARPLGRISREFCEIYNSNMAHQGIYNILGPVAEKTLAKWAQKLKKNNYDMRVLSPNYGQHLTGRHKVTDQEMQTLLQFALNPNKMRISQVIFWAKAQLERQGIQSPASPATLRRALNDWKKTHFDVWTLAREGEKARNDTVSPYIERDWSKIAVGECLVADGHVLNIQVINPKTGRPGRAMLVMWFDMRSRYPAGWNIMFTENTQSIHAALRRAILNLGRIPRSVLLDNGKAFKSRAFTADIEQSGIRGLYARLGIETFFSIAYNAQAKPIERWFGSFNALERMFPSYTGASIADKPAWMQRNEKLHKKIHNPYVPTISEVNDIIRSWAWDVYAQTPHTGRGMNNDTPARVWEAGKGPGVDEAQLRYLMMTAQVKRVHGNGITLFGENYWDEPLYGYRDNLMVRYDIEQMDQVHCYTADGTKYICTARQITAGHPLARLSDDPADKQSLKDAMRQKRALKRQTEQEYLDIVTDNTPWPMIPAETPTAAAPQPRSKDNSQITFTPAEEEAVMRQAAECINILPPDDPEGLDDIPIYYNEREAYEAFFAMQLSGEELTSDQIKRMEAYELTPQYQMLRDYYEGQFRAEHETDSTGTYAVMQ